MKEQAISDLIDKNVNAATPENEVCERYYEQNKSDYKTAPIMSVRHILLASLLKMAKSVWRKNKRTELIEQIKNSNNPKCWIYRISSPVFSVPL